MTTEAQPTAAPKGIDVCSGPSLTRAERIAQEASRFAPSPSAKRNEPPAPRPIAAE